MTFGYPKYLKSLSFLLFQLIVLIWCSNAFGQIKEGVKELPGAKKSKPANNKSDKSGGKTIAISSINSKPVARIKGDSIVYLYLPVDSIELFSISTDKEDGAVKKLKHTWNITSIHANMKQGRINSNAGLSVIAKGLSKGEYKIELQVMDSKGAVSSTSTSIVVIDNRLPFAVKITGLASIYDSEKNVVLKPYVENGKSDSIWLKWELVTGNPASISFKTLSNGSLSIDSSRTGDYMFKVTAKQKDGANAVAYHNLSVKRGKVKPRLINISSPDTVWMRYNYAELQVTAQDDDGYIKSYKWEKIKGGNYTSLDLRSKNLFVSGLESGEYSFKISIEDNDGLITEGMVHFVVVYEKPKETPLENGASSSASSGNSIQLENVCPKMKGGAGNAVVNLFFPGVGHGAVSGNWKGEDRKAFLPVMIGLSYWAAVGGAIYYYRDYKSNYDKYSQLANYRDVQRDNFGQVIGVRGTNEQSAKQYYNSASSSFNTFKLCAGIAGGILVSDFIYTLLKGAKNRKQYKRDNEGCIKSVGLQFNNSTRQFNAGVVLSIK